MNAGPYEVRDCGENAYLISEGFATAFLVVGEEKALLLDCGLGIGDLRSVCETLAGGKPLLLAATHAHVDHVGGMAQFETMLVPEAEKDRVKKCTVAARRHWLRRKKLTGKAKRGVRLYTGGAVPALVPMKEGDEIDLGGRTLCVIDTPGHTFGSVSFLDPAANRVFAGDAVSTYLFLFLPDSDTVETALASVKKLAALEPTLVWACHHRTPFDRERLSRVTQALEALCQKKNTLLPGVKRFEKDGVKVFYRTDRIR